MQPMPRPQAIATLTAPGQPFELRDERVQGRRLRVFAQAPSSLRAMYEATATDLPFLGYEGHDHERLSFREAWQAASRIGHVLVNEGGVQPGDRVAISMRNYPEWMLSFCAITSIGAVAVAMNAHWQADEMRHALVDCGAKVLLADAERLERLAQREPVPGLQVLAVRTDQLPPGVRSLRALTDALGEVPMPPATPGNDDLAIMLYTSGSSGQAKGVPSTHRMVIAALMSWELDAAIREQMAGVVPPKPTNPGTLLAVPLFHVTGLHTSFLSSYRLQRRLTSMYRWDAERAAQIIERERLSSVVGPAAITGDLLRVAKSGKYDLSSLLVVGGGGAPRAPEQVRGIDETFPNAVPNIGWGMTETNAIGAGLSGPDYVAHPTSSGRTSQVLELRVTDELGRTLPPGEQGELWVRGTSVFHGYWNQPEVNAQVFDGDWFRTGDGAIIDAEGYVYIVDRLKDLIIRGGENIGCGHVEAALLAHPEVHEAAVYAVPDERLGEEIGATVHGSPALDLDELREFLKARLAAFEVPRYILKSDAPLPRTPSGKIFKRQIRSDVLNQMKPSA